MLGQLSRKSALNLAWIDLEMTGLNPDRHVIIEIATVVTDPDLNILAEGPNLALRRSKEEMASMESWSARTHGASGLLDRVRESTIEVADAQRQTLDFLSEWIPSGASPLCGNSVHHDRRFLRREMPGLEAYFHYRIVDVSTVKELARRWYPGMAGPSSKPEAHLARDDVLESIAELRRYRDRIFSPATGAEAG